MVDVEITENCIVSSWGRVMPGTILRVNDEYAVILVKDRKVAKYLTAKVKNEKPVKNSTGE